VTLPAQPALGWALRQPGFVVEVVATGFQLPVNIAFAPQTTDSPSAPYFYVVELYGNIKVVLRDGSVHDYVTGLLNFNPTGQFPGSGEVGLTGIAVEPRTGDLFVTMLYDADPPNTVLYPRILRLRSSDGGRTASAMGVVRDMLGERSYASHQISTITIGPDQKLYVHVGDAYQSQTALDLNTVHGKILRLNQNGTPAEDNPFYNAADGITATDFVYAYGMRNPFGGAWRVSDSSLYMVDNGLRRDRLARVVRGENYGWAGDDSAMLLHAIYNWEPSVAPVHIAFVQPEVFDGSGFPADKMGHAFVTESGIPWVTGPNERGKRIREFAFGELGQSLDETLPLIEYVGDGKATAVALAAGPDGLYFSDFYKDSDYQSPIDRGANILRIRYVGTDGE
jgi:glucose/arabinose dehydrogenase